jgi:hypothetical protein
MHYERAPRFRNFGHGMAAPFNLTGAETDFAYLACIGGILLHTRIPPAGSTEGTGNRGGVDCLSDDGRGTLVFRECRWQNETH